MRNIKSYFMAVVFVILLACCMSVPTQAASTTTAKKVVARHTIFSESTMNKRLKKIRNYYYNKPKSLTKKNATLQRWNETIKVTYYYHKDDLMFGYGTSGKKEYRMYFYKKQMFTMYVDKPGKERKIYNQAYKKLETCWYSATLQRYMDLENFARKNMEFTYDKKSTKKLDGLVLITKVSGDKLTYHRLKAYGSDGCIWSIDPQPHTVKMTSNVKITIMDNPYEEKTKSKKWLKERCEDYLGFSTIFEYKNGKVKKIQGLYWA